ncbi:MAG: radical SAM family heme chaperone HemW [Chitinophagaceae bacterium]|nr:radical SAM family heme chaperone HemW [Chitinophagaceae bacterium]
MAGIYIHIPFCKRACNYCNFHFSTSMKLRNDFLSSLLKEIALRKNYIGGELVETIYFGGGTPSLLSTEELSAIFNELSKHFSISSFVEITFEANPDNIDINSLLLWKSLGINRLSIGVQSFFDEDLIWMNRVHSADQAIGCIQSARDAGIDNFSIDLIYGGPTLTDEKWMSNLERAVSLKIPHLSCYALTVEPSTALDVMIRKKKAAPVNTEDQARQFLLMTDYLQAAGYEHYEISNLALPGKRSQHNSSYWRGVKYLGLGPSAHSFNGSTRQWNVANNALYIQSLNNNEIPFEIETLSDEQRFNEYIMTALRTIEGVDINRARAISKSDLIQQSQQFIDKKWVKIIDNKIMLTREGKLFADGIASELFIVR